MARYLTKRAISSLIALCLFVTLLFFITEILIPGDFTTQFSEFMTPEARQAMQEELGLTQPLWMQYLRWVRSLLSGNLGQSYYGAPVSALLKAALPYTLMIFFIGTVVAFQVGQWLGRGAAWAGEASQGLPAFVHKVLGAVTTFGSVAFYTSFPPWLAFLVTYVLGRGLSLRAREFHRVGSRIVESFNFGIWLEAALSPYDVMFRIVLTFIAAWLLLAGSNAAAARRHRRSASALVQAIVFAGLWVGSWYAFGFGALAMNLMSYAIYPLITYVLLIFGETALITRTNMLDTLHEDYLVTARAKGVSEPAVRDRHAARTALLPALSRLVVSLPTMLTGMVIIEDVLDWPGISATLFNALYQQDMPTVGGTLLIVGLISAATRLVLDVLYAYLDPRIRYDRGQLRSVE